jgi:hypothetical protein
MIGLFVVSQLAALTTTGQVSVFAGGVPMTLASAAPAAPPELLLLLQESANAATTHVRTGATLRRTGRP